MGTGSHTAVNASSQGRRRGKTTAGAPDNSGLRRRAIIFGIASALMLLALLGAAGVARAAICTWTGAGVVGSSPVGRGMTGAQRWSVPGNWVGFVAPQAGDDLVFPAAPASFSSQNDFAAGTRFSSITIAGAGYSFSGTRSCWTAGSRLGRATRRSRSASR